MRYKDLLYKITTFSFLETLNVCHPFYLMLDKRGVILSAGNHIKSALKDDLDGKLFSCFFKINNQISLSQLINNPTLCAEINSMTSLDQLQYYQSTFHNTEDYIFIFLSPVFNAQYPANNYHLKAEQLKNYEK